MIERIAAERKPLAGSFRRLGDGVTRAFSSAGVVVVGSGGIPLNGVASGEVED